ncbi:hypothetical protein EWB00_009820 [Schistosoma japonicum]|uniref:Uncharacterized protein n=2 Tax=Schistosoma japonicum TaxID=6182 RepID=A0A4Z2DRL1_SCHJA|nr:hypothetical protein EWB00_009820 [Schistosoma japonicum]
MNNLMNKNSNPIKSCLRNTYCETIQDTTIDEDDNEDTSYEGDSGGDALSDDTLDSSSIAQCDIKNIEQFNYKETTSDVISSLSFLSRRITRKYASEFILPDDTRVAVNRLEGIYPMDNNEQVILSLSVGHKNIHVGRQSANSDQSSLMKHTAVSNSINQRVSSGCSEKSNSPIQNIINEKNSILNKEETNIDESQSDSDSGHHDSKVSDSATDYLISGLQIIDYLEDDLWAATILQCDNSSNSGLLRQLEAGCRLEPEAYRMERVQTVKNRETVIDFPSKPTVRTIGLSRSTSETDSINTTLTAVDFDGET